MDNYPFLLLPRPVSGPRRSLGGRAKEIHYPGADRQQQRIGPKFTTLAENLEAQSPRLSDSISGLEPELVLVIETIGTTEAFIRAVQRVEGLEWLAEVDEENVEPDEDFYVEGDDTREQLLSRQLFMIMTNQRALEEMLSLWRRWSDDPNVSFPYGMARWREVFEHLRDIRPWGVQERVLETGILRDWEARVASGQQSVRFEAELWYRANDELRRAAAVRVEELVRDAGGTVITSADRAEIRYHGMLGEIPAEQAGQLVASPDTDLVRCDQIMFFRPVGQVVSVSSTDSASEGQGVEGLPVGDPVVALLDGLPLANHPLLMNRLIIDDPDDVEADYAAVERVHGTAMASILAHGDLQDGTSPLDHPIYVRPILKPDRSYFPGGARPEVMPDDQLSADLLVRSFRRIYEGDGGEPASAPSIRIVNVSVGDPDWKFDRFISPLARALDWASWNYGCLIVVSAGNQTADLELETPRDAFRNLNADEIQEEVLKSMIRSGHLRRILAPAEAVNALTTGGIHEDGGSDGPFGGLVDPVRRALVSPITSLGGGFRRSIKPDILAPSGRQLYEEKPGTSHTLATLQCVRGSQPPGQQVATPAPAFATPTRFTRGTSNAAALISRSAAEVHDTLVDVLADSWADPLERECIAPLMKALIVHSASWGDCGESLEAVFGDGDSQIRKRLLARLIGYGPIDPARLEGSAPNRATLIGCNLIPVDERHSYAVPLPPSLGGQREWRRLTITLAWLSPINHASRRYRQAHLWVQPPERPLETTRCDVHWQDARRGTVQHEIFDGEAATAISDGDVLTLDVSCRSDAPGLSEPVPYALVVSLEVGVDVQIPVFQEVRDRIRPVIRVTPQAGS